MRKKNEVVRFARWCFAQCGVTPRPITYAPAESLIRNGEYAFGCYVWDEGTRNPGEIYVAYNLPKFGVLSVLAHEIWHHRQQVETGIDNMEVETCEAEAEKAGEELLGMWMIRGGRVKDDRQN